MNTIFWLELSWCAIPVLMVSGIYFYWNGKASEVLYASSRMLVQLLAMGYALVAIFANPAPALSLVIVSIMLAIAAWIAIRPVKHHKGLLIPATLALGGSVLLHLLLSLILVLNVESWFAPDIVIPLAGMYLANSMNAISLSVERYFAELNHNTSTTEAKQLAFKAAMIPQINGLLAVGLVALPGMMTGQILSGVSPLIAVRYQIMIMTMILGTTGLASALMLTFISHQRFTGAEYSK